MLTIDILLIPVISDYDDHRLAERAVDLITRWLVGHLLAAVGFVWAILAFSGIERFLLKKSCALPIFTMSCLTIGPLVWEEG